MATFTSFEEIEAWKQARVLTREVYALTGEGAFARDFALRDQIRRASISIVSNIAEGFERGSTREFIQFLGIARGSAGEVRAQLYVAGDLGYLEEDELHELLARTRHITRTISGLIRYLRRTEHAGLRFRSEKPETEN